MSKTNTGGPAFPCDIADGMTLRDYFAVKAMQSLIINTDKHSAFESDLWVSGIAYEVADAMLEARNKA